jgi:hypothetical protein
MVSFKDKQFISRTEELNLRRTPNKTYGVLLALVTMIRLVLLILCQNSIQEHFQKFVNFDVRDFDHL